MVISLCLVIDALFKEDAKRKDVRIEQPDIKKAVETDGEAQARAGAITVA